MVDSGTMNPAGCTATRKRNLPSCLGAEVLHTGFQSGTALCAEPSYGHSGAQEEDLTDL